MTHDQYITGMHPGELADWMRRQQVPAYRASQVLSWLYRKHVLEFESMKNLPRDLRCLLRESFRDNPWKLAQRDMANDGTVKLLLQARDHVAIETVIIPAGERATVCVSSQAGCPAGCIFCATARGGFERDLTAGEIVAQVLCAARELDARPGNLVFMGMGEPFFNYDAVLTAARILNHPDGFGLGARKITISTCGVVPGIERLAEEGTQFELSVSLHAPDDPLRERLMPVNRRWPLGALLAACRHYTRRTGRIITFEYTLVRDCNDHPEQARRLVDLVSGLPCRFNLIPLSPIVEYEGQSSTPERMHRFQDILSRAGYNTTLRRSKGREIQGACGQLRLQTRKNPDTE